MRGRRILAGAVAAGLLLALTACELPGSHPPVARRVQENPGENGSDGNATPVGQLPATILGTVQLGPAMNDFDADWWSFTSASSGSLVFHCNASSPALQVHVFDGSITQLPGSPGTCNGTDFSFAWPGGAGFLVVELPGNSPVLLSRTYEVGIRLD